MWTQGRLDLSFVCVHVCVCCACVLCVCVRAVRVSLCVSVCVGGDWQAGAQPGPVTQRLPPALGFPSHAYQA